MKLKCNEVNSENGEKHECMQAVSKDHDVDVVEPAQLFTTKILLFLQIATRITLPLFCKKHSIDCIKTELAFELSQDNRTYTETSLKRRIN